MPYKKRTEQLAYLKLYTTEKRRAMRAVIDAAKDRPCMDCGIKYRSCVMQFDHVRGQKKIAIGSATARLKNIDAVVEEIAKCDVVCANCHAERTYLRMVPTNGG